MATLDRPTYIDWEILRWFTSRTRFKLDLALRSVFLELCWKLFEGGGSCEWDPEFLAALVGGGCTIEQVEAVKGFFYQRDNGTFGHRVVDEKLASQKERRQKFANMGRAGGRAKGRADVASVDQADAKADAKRTLPNFQAEAKQGVSEGVSDRESDLRAPARADQTRALNAPQDQPPLKFSPHPPARQGPSPVNPTGLPMSLTPEQLLLSVRRSRPASPEDRDPDRPWCSRGFIRWYDNLRLPEKIAVGEIWEQENPGIGFDTGPIKTRSSANSSNKAASAVPPRDVGGVGNGVDRGTGDERGAQEAIVDEARDPEFDGAEI